MHPVNGLIVNKLKFLLIGAFMPSSSSYNALAMFSPDVKRHFNHVLMHFNYIGQ